MDPDDAVGRILRWVAVFGIDSSLKPQTDVPGQLVGNLLHRAFAHSLGGHIYASLRSGHVSIPAANLQAVKDYHAGLMARSLRLERALIEVSQALEGRGIAHVVLKGAALSHLVYPEPACRTSMDADLLVGGSDLPEAVEAAAGLGLRRRIPEIHPGYDRRFAKDVPVSRQGATVDLHRTLAPGPYGIRSPTEELFEHQVPFVVGSRQLWAPNAAHLLLHAALTAGAADDPPRLVTLSDVARLAIRKDLDLSLLAGAADRSQLRWPVARGLRLTIETLGVQIRQDLHDWAYSQSPSRRERREMDAYLRAGRSTRLKLATIATLPPADAARFAAAISLPASDYRAARGWAPLHHAARAAKSLLRRRGA